MAQVVDGVTTVLGGPDVRSLQQALSISAMLRSAAVGFDRLLDGIDRYLDEAVFSAVLPLVGDQLTDAVRFTNEMRSTVRGNLETRFAALDALSQSPTPADIQQALFDALGPGGLMWLVDTTADSAVTVADVVITTPDADTVLFDMTLHADLADAGVNVAVDLGLPGLGLLIDGMVQLDVGLDFNLGFGLSRLDGAFLDVSAGRDGRRRNRLVVRLRADVRRRHEHCCQRRRRQR